MTEPTQSNPPAKTRKPYQKPKVQKVDLVMEEAVLGNFCKTGDLGGPNDSTCIVAFVSCLDTVGAS